ETELSRQMTTSTTSIDIMGLQAAYANLHTDQERDYFMQRYHDVISSFGGKTSYDADNRPLDRKSGSAGMPRPISYAVFCLKKKIPPGAGGSDNRSAPLRRRLLQRPVPL